MCGRYKTHIGFRIRGVHVDKPTAVLTLSGFGSYILPSLLSGTTAFFTFGFTSLMRLARALEKTMGPTCRVRVIGE